MQGQTGQKLKLTPEQILIDHRKRFQLRLFYAMVCAALLFGFMAFLVISWHDRNPKDLLFLPKSMVTGLVVLFLCNLPLLNRVQQFASDEAGKIVIGLSTAILISVLFMCFQLYSAVELFNKGISFSHLHANSILLISILVHTLMVLPCVTYLFYLWIRSFDAWNDPVKSLIYFSNKYEMMRLEYVGYAFHWLSFLWVMLFFVFHYTY